MKLLTIIALAVAMVGVSACAHKEQSGGGSYQSSTSTSSHHHGYSK